MSRKKRKDPSPGPAAAAGMVLRLYVSNGAPNSLQAVANLAAICKEYLENQFKLGNLSDRINVLHALGIKA
jgi:hypothetical protein